MGKTRRLCHLLLRFLAFVATLSTVIVTVTSHETPADSTLPSEAKYTIFSALKYFVISNSVVTVYGILVLFLPAKSLLWRLVVVLDLVLMMLLMSSFSAALAIGEVGKKGNSYAFWLPICDSVPKFCNQVEGALIAGFIAVIIYMILVLLSLQSAIDPLLLRKY